MKKWQEEDPRNSKNLFLDNKLKNFVVGARSQVQQIKAIGNITGIQLGIDGAAYR